MKWDMDWTITKEDLAGHVLDVVRVKHNGLTTAGKTFIFEAILGQATTNFFDFSALGVGNGITPFAPSQTDLQGAVATYVLTDTATIGADSIFFSSLFGAPPTPRVWAEFALFDAVVIRPQNQITDFFWGAANGDPSDPTGGVFDVGFPNTTPSAVTLDFDAASNGDASLQAVFDAAWGVGNSIVSMTSVGQFTLELTGIYGGFDGGVEFVSGTVNLTGPDAPNYTGSAVQFQAPIVGVPALMLNRRVANLGTQPITQNWRLNSEARMVG